MPKNYGQPEHHEPNQVSVYLDYGPPLPDTYGQDSIFAMVRDPECIFVYWELSVRIVSDTFRLRDLKKHSTKWVLRTHNLSRQDFFDTNLETPANPDNVHGNYYLTVLPDNKYQLELGLLNVNQFIPLVKSNIIRTPRQSKSTGRAESSYI